jgi:hypothetical protein
MQQGIRATEKHVRGGSIGVDVGGCTLARLGRIVLLVLLVVLERDASLSKSTASTSSLIPRPHGPRHRSPLLDMTQSLWISCPRRLLHRPAAL